MKGTNSMQSIIILGTTKEASAARLPTGMLGHQMAIILQYCSYVCQVRDLPLPLRKDGQAYSLSDWNHPVASWLIHEEHAFEWVVAYCLTLGEEWYKRNGRYHACFHACRDMVLDIFDAAPHVVIDNSRVPDTWCFHDDLMQCTIQTNDLQSMVDHCNQYLTTLPKEDAK